MSREDSVSFVKRNLVDIIYRSAKLEKIAVTLIDTYVFTNSVNTGKISADDMLKLKGLKDAYVYVMDSLDEELNIYYIKKSILKFVKVKIFYHWTIFVIDE